MVNYLDSRRIVGTTAERSSIPIPATAGGWVEVGRTTLEEATSTLSVSSLPDKRYYMVLSDMRNSTSANNYYRLNNDTGNNYASRRSDNGGATDTNTSWSVLTYLGNSNSGTNQFNVGYLANRSANEKLIYCHTVSENTAGASTPPNRMEAVGKHAQTSNPISTISIVNLSNTLASGSEMVVLGWDPADTHTNNFWEELADVNGTNATTISSGTISAKKYLWIQLYCDAASSGAPILRFNSDSGSNYARSYSNNGGANSTSTSEDAIYPYYQSNANPKFINMFVINNQSNEKLVISHTVEQNTAGATNAPFRNELVGKWANTSNQITNITFTDISAGNYFGTSAQLRVWGAD